jgi:hypothetical protein
MHFLSHAVPAALCFDDRLVKKIREVIHVLIGTKDHIAATPTVAAIRPTLGHKLLPPKTHASPPATAGLRKNFYPIDKHGTGNVKALKKFKR